MTHHHLTGWNMPSLSDGDVIVNSNLKGVALPMVKLHFARCNLRGATLIDGLHTTENCSIGEIVEYPEESIIDVDMAANAEIVKTALLSISELTPENIAGITYLCDTTKQIAGTTATLGEAATKKTLDIISALERYGKPEHLQLAEQMRQMLIAVQRSGVIQ